MATIRLRFVNAGGAASALIRAAQLGFLYTHVDIETAGGLIGAHLVGGVAERPVGYDAPVKAERVIAVEASPDQAERLHAFARGQLGKRYDMAAIADFALAALGVPFRVAAPGAWRKSDRWFCSELAAAALIEAGILPPDLVEDRHITPEALAMIVGTLAVARPAQEAS